MEILRLIHDEEHKRQLFGYVGEFAASAKVRQELGGNITSTPGQIWFVAMEKDDVLGFASIVQHKNDTAKMINLYSPVERSEIRRKIISKCIAEAKRMKQTKLLTTDYSSHEVEYKKTGWIPTTVRGRFTNYTLEIKT